MTILTSPTVIGIDVAKAEIVAYREDSKITQAINNDRETLGRWLKALPAQSSIALEATSIYHLDTVELAHEMGHRVYVVDAYRLSHYRESIGQRAKTDLVMRACWRVTCLASSTGCASGVHLRRPTRY